MSQENQVLNRYARDFQPGQLIIEDASLGKEMYILQSGLVKVFKVVNGVEKVFATLGPGEFFGEMALFNNKPRSANVAAEQVTRVIVIDSKTLESMIKNNAEIAIRMLKKFASRLDSMDLQIETLMMKDKNRKVVHMLGVLAQEKGEKTSEGIKVETSCQQLAGTLGLSPEDTQSVLDKIIKARLIRQDADSIIIFDTTKLIKFLEFLVMKEEFGDFN